MDPLLADHPVLVGIKGSMLDTLSRLRGRVRKVRADKGFGFVAGDDGVDYFFHHSTFKKSTTKQLKDLSIGDRIEFSPIIPPPQDDRKVGPRAIEIVYLDE